MKHWFVYYAIHAGGIEYGDVFLADATSQTEAQKLANAYATNLADVVDVSIIQEVTDPTEWRVLEKYLSYAITWDDVADQLGLTVAEARAESGL